MISSLQSLWRAKLFLCLGLFLHSGEARVHTEAQAGPLYRVEGSRLSIFCNVSGFSDDISQKEFEFRVVKPAQPTFDINIISTSDDDFGYAVYSGRVKTKEITLTHVTPNSVVFEIRSLRKSDEGDFECSVINPESVFDGTYSAKTTVKVIDNSLSVSSPASTSLSYNEGDALTLTCQASSNTVQHTHLSLAWYLRKNDEEDAQRIISLDRDFKLSPGQGFERRYQDGLIRLDKMGETTYKLKMAQLQLSDQGKIFCQAQEWVQDPDRSWYPIAEMDAEESTLNVKAREVVSDTSSLVVSISAQPETLQEGQELSLSCDVDTQNPWEKFFSVAWLRGTDELAHIGPTGILSVGPQYSVREKELRVFRIGGREYRLILQPVRIQDQGEYFCRAWPENRGQDGAFTQGAAQDSKSQLVSISATESGLSLEMQNSASFNEGDRLNLTCGVQGVKGQLSVTWQYKATPTSVFTSVISLSQEGVTEKAKAFMSRKVKAIRPATDTFILELDEVTASDSGVYQCAVSEWKINQKTNSQSQTATVTVAPADKFVKVNLVSRDNIVTVGQNVELICRVRGIVVPVTVTWSLQRDASTVDNILTVYSSGAISWSGVQHRYQLRVETKPKEIIHYLVINGASQREAGSYQCSVSVFEKNVHKKLRSSNQLAVKVQNPVSKLVLISPSSLTSDINTDIEMTCSVISEPSASSRYAVTWLLQQQGENKTIVSSDQDGFITFGPQLELSFRQRISMKRIKRPSFELSIRQARISDQGSYVCQVVELLQDPSGDWNELSPVSKTIKITVVEPVNDLRLDKTEQWLVTREGNDVELKCDIISGVSSPSFFYKVTWFHTEHNSSDANALVELDHTGLLNYPANQRLRGLQDRLRLSRPTRNSFYLSIQRAHEEDGATYQCQVEQYQLDRDGRWQQKASESAGVITLTVKLAEKNLSILKDEVELNVSTSQNFTIPCHITQQSSSESEFQVTWFWQKDGETKKWPIFTTYRNSTLQDRLGKGDKLRFSHPLPNSFSLTVLKPHPEDRGLYFCEVEEWLPSLSFGWRKVAVEKSGYLIVEVSAEGNFRAATGSECMSGTWIGILVAVVICALLVIFVLVLKISRTKEGRKSEKSLWAEEHPLKTKPSAVE